MKKTLLISLFLIPFLGISQTKKSIDGFLGVKFGSTKATVTAALVAKGGALNKKQSKINDLCFDNLKLGNRSAEALLVSFVDGKAFQAYFLFDPKITGHTIDYYNELVNDLNEIYGEGKSEKNYKDPYNDNDSEIIKMDAIKNGNASFTTTWIGGNENVISVTINEDLLIELTYQDSKLAEEAVKKQKATYSSDY